jgi:hypothetical protein
MTPQAPENDPPTHVPGYSLYDSGGVMVAALFGSPLAGGHLMAMNYRRMGMVNKATVAFAVALGITILGVALGYVIPSYASTGLAIGMVVAMRQYAIAQQGPAVNEHIVHGGLISSKWAAFGIGMAWLAALVVVIFAGAFGWALLTGTKPGTKVVFGTNDNITYSGTATRQDADALGQALKAAGYFTDRGASVLLSKDKTAGTILSFAVREGFWDNPQNVAGFEALVHDVAPSVGGLPVTLRLVNANLEIKKESTVK